MTINNGNGTRDWWKTIAGAGWGILAGMTIAWFTAYTRQGITRSDMESYVKDYSPYVMDKRGIEEHQRQQDERMTKIESYLEQERNQNGNGQRK